MLEVAYDIPDTRMRGKAAWFNNQKFWLEAKSSPDMDRQLASLSSEQGRQLKRRLLIALLEERFKLAVHTETREMPVYAMSIAKGGPKLAGGLATDAPLPGNDHIGVQAGSDSLEVLAYELSWRLGRPVLDRTGLVDRQALTHLAR